MTSTNDSLSKNVCTVGYLIAEDKKSKDCQNLFSLHRIFYGQSFDDK